MPFADRPSSAHSAPPLSHERDDRVQSVAWKVNREIVVLLGWAPAILAQLAHPLVAEGVARHSDFQAGPTERIARLRSTVDAMLALTFGTPAERASAASRINGIHDLVGGVLRQSIGPFPAGTPYSAHDPDLLRWVHATLLDTLPRAYQLFVGPLADAERDLFCAEARAVEPLLGIPPGFLPGDDAALRRYLAAMRASGQIVVGETARALAVDLLNPSLNRLAEPSLALARLATAGLLDPGLRRAYGLAWGPRHSVLLRLTAGAVRRVVGAAPGRLRDWPAARVAFRRAASTSDGRPIASAGSARKKVATRSIR